MSHEIPYGFVPVAVERSVTDTPVFHDGSQPDLLSGELRCTLRVLTPLIAANDQYDAEEVVGATIVKDENDRKKYKIRLPDSWGINCGVAPDKHVIEPLRLSNGQGSSRGRVGIAGTALKGTLRASLSALLGAPMERAAVRKKKGEHRRVLLPLSSEVKNQGGRPLSLSAARLLFGYVSHEEFGTQDVGRDGFDRLAGRLAFNIAVEQTDRPDDEARFLEGGRAIPLKILAQPKPNKYENVVGEPGQLAGRKFYYHQPPAATDPSCYRASEHRTIAGNQAILARFVSKPGTEFRFALRFEGLRLWELGAVLIAFDPSQLKGGATRKDDRNPEYALKLGHGRPLGLGSVSVSVDDISIADARGNSRDGAPECEAALEAVRDMMPKSRVDEAWLLLHRYRGQGHRYYETRRPAPQHRQSPGQRR